MPILDCIWIKLWEREDWKRNRLFLQEQMSVLKGKGREKEIWKSSYETTDQVEEFLCCLLG